MRAASATAAFTSALVIPLGVCSSGGVTTASISSSGVIQMVFERYGNDATCQASSSGGINIGTSNSTFSPYGSWNTISYAQGLTIPSTGTYKIM